MNIIEIKQPESYLIAVGAFYDRFGDYKWQILSSNNTTIQALVKDCSVRKYIDLKRTDLGIALDLVIAAAGFSIDKQYILGTSCQAGEEP